MWTPVGSRRHRNEAQPQFDPNIGPPCMQAAKERIDDRLTATLMPCIASIGVEYLGAMFQGQVKLR